jgi:site-specific DNA recombinase
VQAILAEDAHERMGKTQTRHKTDALLRGLMYGPDGGKYHITYSKKPSGKKYRYYIPKADKRYGYRSSATGMIPADQIEEVVVNLLVGALQSPESIQGVWNAFATNTRRSTSRRPCWPCAASATSGGNCSLRSRCAWSIC